MAEHPVLDHLGETSARPRETGYPVKPRDPRRPIGFTTWVARASSTSAEIRIDQDIPNGPEEWEQFHVAYYSALADLGTARENRFKEKEVGVGYIWWTSYPGYAIDYQMKLWLRIKTRLFVFRYFPNWVQCYCTGARVRRIWGGEKVPHVKILLSEE